MHRFSLIQIKKRSFGLLWLMLGIYVWLSSAVQLAHTEDLRAALISAAVAAAEAHVDTAPSALPHSGASQGHPAPHLSLHDAVAAAPDEPCAACEWIASVHVVSTPGIDLASLPVSYDLVRALHFETALLQRSNRTVTLRGPPAA